MDKVNEKRAPETIAPVSSTFGDGGGMAVDGSVQIIKWEYILNEEFGTCLVEVLQESAHHHHIRSSKAIEDLFRLSDFIALNTM